MQLVYMVIDESTTAHEVWKRLKDIFHDNKDAKVIQLDNEIRNMNIGNLSVTDYFQEIKSKADRLANLGSTVCNSSLVTYAINDLRSGFPKIARIIRHTFDNVRSIVLLEESDMAFNNNVISSSHNTYSSPSVLVATMANSGIEQCRNFRRDSSVADPEK